jgi:hypothetical protein
MEKVVHHQLRYRGVAGWFDITLEHDAYPHNCWMVKVTFSVVSFLKCLYYYDPQVAMGLVTSPLARCY